MKRRAACAVAVVGLVLAASGSAQASNGIFERTWGFDVIAGGGTGFEICTIASSCKQGIQGVDQPGGAMDFPVGAAVNPSGDVVVADENDHRIQVFDSSGTFLRAWGKNVVANGPDDTVGGGFEICTAVNGDVCQGGASDTSLGGELNFPFDVATDPSGNVYVSDSGNGRIQKFSETGTFLRAWGKNVVASGPDDTGGGGFEICVAANIDTCQAGGSGGLAGEFFGLGKIATDPTGAHLYATDGSAFRVQEFDTDGNFVRTWGKDVINGGGTDFEVCEATGPDPCKAGESGSLGGELSFPNGIGVDSSGDVYVTEFSGNQRVDRFTSIGTFLRAWGKNVVLSGLDDTAGGGYEVCIAANADVCTSGTNGILGGEFNGPYDVDVDGSGAVYVAEPNQQRVQKFDSLGAFQQVWGTDVIAGGGTGYEVCTVATSCKNGIGGTLGGDLLTPAGLAATASGVVYVADSSNNRIQEFVDSLPPPGGGPPAGTAPTSTPTGQRAAALKRCKKKFRHKPAKRRKCKRRANRLPL
jgi:tripartite motif-containing protein 71